MLQEKLKAKSEDESQLAGSKHQVPDILAKPTKSSALAEGAAPMIPPAGKGAMGAGVEPRTRLEPLGDAMEKLKLRQSDGDKYGSMLNCVS